MYAIGKKVAQDRDSRMKAVEQVRTLQVVVLCKKKWGLGCKGQ